MYRNQFNYNHSSVRGERITQPTKTIQGEAYTIQELYRKFATGQIPPIHREGDYMDDVTFDDPDIRKVTDMDMVERQQYANDISATITKLKDDVKKSRQKPIYVPVVGTDPKTDSKPDNNPKE